MSSLFANKHVLVVVESPAKAKLVAKYVTKKIPEASKVQVEASFGHIRDLDKKELGVDFEKKFRTEYFLDPKKRAVIDKLRKGVKHCDLVLLASDNDREGEAIAWHLKDYFKLDANKYKRIVFNEITEKAIAQALDNLHDIDMDLVHAQQSRRIIDRIVGFKISPLLWGEFRVNRPGGGGLSAGRVQSAALNMIMSREREVMSHTSTPFWTMKGDFIVAGYAVEHAKLMGCVGNDVKDVLSLSRFDNKSVVENVMNTLTNKFDIQSSGAKLHDVKESPSAPFTTSSLQQEAYNKLGMGVKMTMMCAQKLYEMGLITYMRTDSYSISKDAQNEIAQFVENEYGKSYVATKDYGMTKKVKNSQQAHEAIRPTRIDYDGMDIKDGAAAKLYDLIRKRTVASQMIPAIKAVLDMHIVNKGFKYADAYFKGVLSIIKEPGYLRVWGEKKESDVKLRRILEMIENGNAVNVECVSIVANNGWTTPPHRYNEAALVKDLEREGLGRPSTYASILEKLYEKNYVVVQDVASGVKPHVDITWTPNAKILDVNEYEQQGFSDKSRLVPTDIGKGIHAYLLQHFKDLLDTEFTAHMEDELDEIANGNKDHLQVMQEFWDSLAPRVALGEENKKRSKDRQLLEIESIPFKLKDGREYAARIGKYGPILENVVAEKDDPRKYIDLKAYLKMVRKSYSDLTLDEVDMLAQMPKAIGKSGVAELQYGRFGFYVTVKETKESYTVPWRFVKDTLEGSWLNVLKIDEKMIIDLIKMKKEYLEKKVAVKEAKQEAKMKKKVGKTKNVGADGKTTAIQKPGKPTSKPNKNKDKYKPKALVRAEAAKAALVKAMGGNV